MSEDTVKACPNCDGTRVRYRTQDETGGCIATNDETWFCKECETYFDSPNNRPKQKSGARQGDAKTLLEMDPSDVPALSD